LEEEMKDLILGQEVIIINPLSTFYLCSGKISKILSQKMYKVKMKSTEEEIFFFISELGEVVGHSNQK